MRTPGAVGLKALSWAALLATACGRSDAPPTPISERLPEGVAARVGSDDVSIALVRSVAAAQGVTPAVARDLAVSDALWASYARERFRGTGRVEAAERGALARAVLEELRAAAVAQGPPTDAEVEERSQVRWQDVARPALARTIHAVVLVKSPDQTAKARGVAERMAAALHGITDPTEFENRAKALDAEGLEIRVEQLLPVAPDGRLADPRQSDPEPRKLELAYAQAAHAIPEVGEQSPVIQSSYGFHVILLLERLGERVLDLEQRRNLLEREIMDRRAQAAHQRLLEQINRTTPVVVDRAVADLLQRVRIAR